MNLTPKQIQAIRIAVANVAGFFNIQMRMWNPNYPDAHQLTGFLHGRVDGGYDLVPNYPASLDAVHEVEVGLIFSKRRRYFDELNSVMAAPIDHCIRVADSEMALATALQRCIALLMTLAPEKWLEIQNLKD